MIEDASTLLVGAFVERAVYSSDYFQDRLTDRFIKFYKLLETIIF